MKCPNCGFEMQEGHLICENCGYEYKIVPDFEPDFDVEIEIDNNLVDVVLDEDKKINDAENEVFESDNNDSLEPAFRNRIIMLGTIILAALLILGVAVWLILHTGSVEYQIDKAKKQAIAGNYESAISTLENLHVSHQDIPEIFYLEAQYYQEMNKPDMAEDTLLRMLSSNLFEEEEKYIAYDRLISLYAECEKYNEINKLLENCDYEDIKLSYQNYMAMPPVFSEPDGVYSDAIRLKISANTSGTIYYTLDGSVPNSSGLKYDSPILLEHGDYEISAIFVNQYGIESEMVTAKYNIVSDLPDTPIVNADSDSYEVPVLITCEVPEGTTVYYTTDKSTPTIDSVQYTDPIPMPIGYSNFNFIAINEQGLSSEVVVRSYELKFPNGLSTAQAVDALKNRLIERGLINDANGTSDRAPGRYTYQVISAIPISGQGDYYTIREFYHDGTGNNTPTDTTYIVEIYQGSTAILGGDAVNGFLAISF